MTRLRANRIAHLHRMADMLYRRAQGDSIAKLAGIYHVGENYIYMELARARANADVKAEAVELEGRQLSSIFIAVRRSGPIMEKSTITVELTREELNVVKTILSEKMNVLEREREFLSKLWHKLFNTGW